MKVYETRDEAVYREVVGPIEATGVVENAYEQYDVDAIADEVVALYIGYGGGHGVYQDTRPSYAVDETVDFWAVVARHER